MDKYAELRAALEQTCHALLIDDPDTIRALLDERDALRKFVEAKMHHLPIEDQYVASVLVDELAQEQGEKHDNQD